jgi:hypothetical protein
MMLPSLSAEAKEAYLKAYGFMLIILCMHVRMRLQCHAMIGARCSSDCNSMICVCMLPMCSSQANDNTCGETSAAQV